MALNSLKKTLFHENERLDLEDLVNGELYRDAKFAEMMRVLLAPGPYGLVLQGLTGTVSAGPVFTTSAITSIAFDVDGNLVTNSGAVSLTVHVDPNASNYVHAYWTDQDSDTDSRKFINSAVDPAEEYSANVETTQTRVMQLYVVSNSDTDLLIDNFQQTATIGGKVRNLIAVCAFKTDASTLIAGSYIDFRQRFDAATNVAGMDPVGDQYPAESNDTTINSLAGYFRAVTTALRRLHSWPLSTDKWWDSTYLRTDPLNSAVSDTLRNRILSAKSVEATVSPTANRGEYTNVFTAAAAVSALGGGVVRVKPGTHQIAAPVSWTGVSKVVIDGGDATSSKIVFGRSDTPTPAPLLSFGDNCANITFRNLSFSISNFYPDAYFLFAGTTGITDIVFEKCKFSQGGLSALERASGAAFTRVKFIDCEFTDAVFGGTTQWSSTDFTEFINCSWNASYADATFFDPYGGGKPATNLRFRGCKFGSIGGYSYKWLSDTPASTTQELEFLSCTFLDANTLISRTTQAESTVKWRLVDCILDTQAVGLSPLFNNASTDVQWSADSYVHFTGCYIRHNGIMHAGSNGSLPAFSLKSCTLRHPLGAEDKPWFDFLTLRAGLRWQPCLEIIGCDISCVGSPGVGSASLVHLSLYSGVTGTSRHNITIKSSHVYVGTASGVNYGTGIAVFALIDYSPVATLSAGGPTVVVSDCSFNNANTTTKPLSFIKASGGGSGSYSLNYTWRNGTDGAVGDSGITNSVSGTYRLADNPTRLLAAT